MKNVCVGTLFFCFLYKLHLVSLLFLFLHIIWAVNLYVIENVLQHFLVKVLEQVLMLGEQLDLVLCLFGQQDANDGKHFMVKPVRTEDVDYAETLRVANLDHVCDSASDAKELVIEVFHRHTGPVINY